MQLGGNIYSSLSLFNSYTEVCSVKNTQNYTYIYSKIDVLKTLNLEVSLLFFISYYRMPYKMNVK